LACFPLLSPALHCTALRFAPLVAATTPKNTQNKHEQVYEVQEELESADQCEPGHLIGRTSERRCVALEPLCVIRDETREDQHSCIGDNPVKSWAAQKNIDDASDDEAQHRHGQDSTEARQVYTGGVANDA